MAVDATGGAGAVLLGLPDFVLLAAGEVAGEVELLVETTATVAGCPRCGVLAELHGRRPVLVRDLPAAGRSYWCGRSVCGAARNGGASSGPGPRCIHRWRGGRC